MDSLLTNMQMGSCLQTNTNYFPLDTRSRNIWMALGNKFI